ncbi:GNAT family N-acetyltransferase [Anaerocolumna cellulosilytica]|nr:GNAT family N-acetyltransferase [Anaerocolumna cellulosilytica]MBB5197734.1 RimJ/RimL family protein N-acetyltransferase [Anaerocolumna cellulosilytica]
MENIITERLIIRRFLKTDWQDLYEYLSDPEVVYFEPYEVYTQEQAMEEAIRRIDHTSFFAVCLKDSQKLIGNLYFNRGDFDTWELGYVFNRTFQKQGYAMESATALINHAFSCLGARRIIARCSTKNVSSWRLLERLRLRREGMFLQNVYFKTKPNGEPDWFDSYSYAILKEEWIKNNSY